MKKFVKIEKWDYMDMHPTVEVRTFKGDDLESIKNNAKAFVAHMTEMYSGGTTKYLGIMTAEEAKKHIEKVIAKEHANWQDDSQEFIDDVNKLYKECYE